jgi:class 3 adenylate cyclase
MSAFLLGLLVVGLIAAVFVVGAASLRLQQNLTEVGKRLRIYFPAGVADQVLAREGSLPTAKLHSNVTIVVMRIQHFEHLTANLTPHHTLHYINECLLLCGTAVHRNRGVIERYLEDGLVAVFGLHDVPGESHAYRGTRAALEATRMVAAMKARWEKKGRRAYRIGAGVHSGEIIAGDVGFGDQRAFGLVGSTALLARQLQRLSEELNTSVLLSNVVYEQVEGRFVTTRVPNLPASRLYQSQDVYLVRGLGENEATTELKMPSFDSISTLLMSDVQDADFKEIMDEREWETELQSPAALPGRREFNLDDKPIVPDLTYFDRDIR